VLFVALTIIEKRPKFFALLTSRRSYAQWTVRCW